MPTVSQLLFLLIFPFGLTFASDRPIRNISTGLLQGFFHFEPGIEAEVFLGIPFAKPPVGQLRFESPVRPDPWKGVRDASLPAPWCVQFWYPDGKVDKRVQSEDCLYLNLFVPRNHSRAGPYPVLMWIHGGSYQVNGANMFPVDGVVRNLVAEGLIVVTVNYRLGPLGFLSTLNKELPGNYGLEDQMMAMVWVQENIEHFDGDPDRVTVGGESAGASSISILAVSPRGKSLFHGAIIRSGSALAPWAVRSSNTDMNSLLIIRWTKCDYNITDMKSVKECLQSVDLSVIQRSWNLIGNQDLLFVLSGTVQKPQNYNHPFLAHTYFTPVVDGYRGVDSIIPTYPADLIEQNAGIPVMIGVTTAECAAYVTWLYFLSDFGEIRKSIDVDLKNLEFVVPGIGYANPEQVKQAVYHQYIWKKETEEAFDYSRALVEITSDQNFVAPATMEAEMYADAGVPAFLYIFEHSNEELNEKHFSHVGAAHGYDMVFQFQSTSVMDPIGRPLNWTPTDLYITEFLSRTTANFVKKGNPTVNDLPAYWPEYTHKCGKALFINPSPKLTDFFPEVKSFWQDTIPMIEMLTFQTGYEHYHPVTCVENCPTDFKLGFFLALAASILLTLALVTIFIAQYFTKRNSYHVDSTSPIMT